MKKSNIVVNKLIPKWNHMVRSYYSHRINGEMECRWLYDVPENLRQHFLHAVIQMEAKILKEKSF